ncbi:OLC1v1027532C1 [Oldenlandia corymbosa var. corymbosa]|uniref:OLC1v1027532C1 n=1 Tax=Oldenlandia corymbosa var. corymbosa TaxID=529605 RepID=A0AAV1CAG0_OLDCO|nr:OLC1v1027532C1 [Oldenlandia corymbosa var. corymbosa]
MESTCCDGRKLNLGFHGSISMEAKARYEELRIRESLNTRSYYPAACKELGYILRNAYSKAPKILQSLIFEDTIAGFRLLPVMSTQAAMSSANVLLQNAEFALPKQKKILAVTACKQAMVTCKRQGKSQQEEEGALEFPEDILIHIFSFLDMQSLVSAGMVSRLWCKAASDDHLWESLYVKFFGFSNDRTSMKRNASRREEFKSVYGRPSYKNVAPYRGFCSECRIVWLTDSKCYRTHSGRMCRNHNIFPISMQKIVDYVLHDCSQSESSSDSDSDIEFNSRLWAYNC